MKRQRQGSPSPVSQPSHTTAPALTILRTDTVFAKLPIHNLTKREVLRIHIVQSNQQGSQDLYWQVSPSTAYGPPQQLAYKLDTLLINRHLDRLERPLPTLIRLGSLRQICDDLGLRIGRSVADLKRAFHQNAGAYITAKVTYRDAQGRERRLEAGFNRFGVVFTGESLPDGTCADAVYIILNESYRHVLNAAPTRPVDYDYLTFLKPLAQRFYELLSFKMYAALKYQHPQVWMRYSELCQFAPQQRYLDGAKMSKQMHKVHLPHLESGYLAEVQTERVLDPQGEPDWLLHYTPGPKAQAEYQAFTRPHRKARLPLQSRAGAVEPAEALGGHSEAALAPTIQAEAQTDPYITALSHCERNAWDEIKPREPVVAWDDFGKAFDTPSAADNQADVATALVQQFYREVHGVAHRTPHPKEIEHASGLLHRHGSEFTSFFLTYAQRAVRREGRTIHVFGGLMRYEASALAAYQRQEVHAAKAQSKRTAEQQRRHLDAYEDWLRQQLEALKATLAPAELEALQCQVRQHLCTEKGLPYYLLERQVAHDVDTQLIDIYRLPSFEIWSQGKRTQL
jgi:hypothetical protein